MRSTAVPATAVAATTTPDLRKLSSAAPSNDPTQQLPFSFFPHSPPPRLSQKMSALSNACAALLLLAATTTPTCEAFVASSSPYTRQVPTTTAAARCRSSLDGLERPRQQQQRQRERSGRTGTMMMAVSHAAAEEISNMEDVGFL